MSQYVSGTLKKSADDHDNNALLCQVGLNERVRFTYNQDAYAPAEFFADEACCHSTDETANFVNSYDECDD